MNKQKQENQQDKKYQNKTHTQSSNMGWKIFSDLLGLHFFPLPVSHRVKIYTLLLYRSTTSSLWKAHFGIFILCSWVCVSNQILSYKIPAPSIIP